MRMRPRRLRRTLNIRALVRETHLSCDDLIYPIFVVPGVQVKAEISALPGQFHWSVDRLPEVIDQVLSCGIKAVLLFGLPEGKDCQGSESFAKEGVVQKAIRLIKAKAPDLVVITDVCLCSYTDHGHCGVIEGDNIANDSTLSILQKIAVSHAEAGADWVAPSGMMDG
ncbi:MAG: porphobilinogen synthase, partial [Gammaproteobacteria bacterium]|nr:porphobilinogen synthase [Gammaproteobacteria bacterium]